MFYFRVLRPAGHTHSSSSPHPPFDQLYLFTLFITLRLFFLFSLFFSKSCLGFHLRISLRISPPPSGPQFLILFGHFTPSHHPIPPIICPPAGRRPSLDNQTTPNQSTNQPTEAKKKLCDRTRHPLPHRLALCGPSLYLVSMPHHVDLSADYAS